MFVIDYDAIYCITVIIIVNNQHRKRIQNLNTDNNL